jgi:hypothetical protein
MRLLLSLLLVLLTGTITHAGAQVPKPLNTSFETHSVTSASAYNLKDPVFNSKIQHVHAFAQSFTGVPPEWADGETDIIITYEEASPAPGGGDTYLGLAGADRISIEMDRDFNGGQNYTFTYLRARTDEAHVYPYQRLIFSISPASSEQGNDVYTETTDPVVYFPDSSPDRWETVTFTFTAPVTGKYLVVRTMQAEGGWAHFDLPLSTSTLPVHLLSFTAIQKTNGVQLDWKTGDHTARFFSVERSEDGIRFTKLGHINPASQGMLSNQFSFLDKAPRTSLNYYRLQTTEASGRIHYSQVIAVALNRINRLTVFPNPATTTLYVQCGAAQDKLLVQDITGRVKKTVLLNTTGVNATSVDISCLPQGVYFVRVGREAIPFVKQ